MAINSGLAVTAEEEKKKKTSRESKENWHSFLFVCRQTVEGVRGGQWPSAQKYHLHENVSVYNKVHCLVFPSKGWKNQFYISYI